MSYKIDKGIELPKKGRNSRKTKYPWWDMEVGDSFFVPKSDNPPNALSPSKFVLATGRKFARRQATNGKTRGIRVWRIK